MKYVALLGLGLAAVIAAACSSDPSSGPGAGATTGPDGGPSSSGEVPPGGRLPDGGFNDPPFEAPACGTAEGAVAPEAKELVDETGKATAKSEGTGCARTFSVDSTAPRKDNLPAGPRQLDEKGAPSLQTTSPLFDALYQLALADAKEASVAAIRDGAFNEGNDLKCAEGGCFETGRKWTYVWTRDTAYASNLGLAWVDPVRARNSLELKLSKRRDGTDLEIVQDTGTGGSYPVSTDRAVWALGAGEVLQHLTGDARTKFRDTALEAAKNTIAQDRATIFDEADGLYRGEQSFLDWREQTYPGWANPDTVHIGMSKSLSTNVAHLSLLDLAATLAMEVGDQALTKTMQERARALRAAIRMRFWLDEDQQLSTFITTSLDPAPARRFDLLGTSLAVLLDAASPEQAKAALASYPTLPKGPPVVFPQQKDTPIYHNRAIWPFVTAYWVKAAKKVANDRAFEAGIKSLVRGAALNLSNMENLEAVSGAPFVEDGANSGPVVNSQRQIWSVAGYIGMVNGSLFGVEATKGGVRVAPFLTRGVRTLFPGAKSIALNDVTVRGKKLTVVLKLPDDADVAKGGAYVVKKTLFNSVPLEADFIDDVRLKDKNLVTVELGLPANAPAALRTITDTSDYRTIFAPRTPGASVALEGGKLTVTADFAGENAAEITWSVYRDGARVAFGLGAFQNKWTDATTSDASPSHCYTVETRFGSSGNLSQHARPTCFWGTGNARISSVPAGNAAFTVTGGAINATHGRMHADDWGNPGDEITATFTATRTGAHLVQAVYANGAGPINTGITGGVKHVTVEELPAGNVVAAGYMLMPQRGDWDAWGDSSFVRATLGAGKSYRVRLAHDLRSTNMSSFEHFAAYTGGLGGKSGTFLKVNVAEIKLLALVP